MNKLGPISLLWLILFFSCAMPASAGTGDLQVTCDQGVRVFVDNVFKGVSKGAEGGLFISDLAPGPHTVKVLKKGAPPYEKEVVIKESEAVELVVKFEGATPEKAVAPSPEKGAAAAPGGVLELRSAPSGADVLIDGEKKTGKTNMRIENVRAGQHTILFQRDRQDLSGTFSVESNKTLELNADFKKGVLVNISELKKDELEKERARQEEKEQKQLKTAETGQPQVQGTGKVPLPVPGAGQAPSQMKVAEKTPPVVQRPAVSEAAKPYGELFLDVTVSRGTTTEGRRDTLLVKFPDKGVPPDGLLDAHFLKAGVPGESVTYKTEADGRSISAQLVISPREGSVSKSCVLHAYVKEGGYTVALGKKKWKIDFYSDRKIADKASGETIVIKRGEKLRVKIQYEPDKDDAVNLIVEKSYEPVGAKFYEEVDSLLKKNH